VGAPPTYGCDRWLTVWPLGIAIGEFVPEHPAKNVSEAPHARAAAIEFVGLMIKPHFVDIASLGATSKNQSWGVLAVANRVLIPRRATRPVRNGESPTRPGFRGASFADELVSRSVDQRVEVVD
jgi:hypothetical protein